MNLTKLQQNFNSFYFILEKHKYHMVTQSPWPIFMAISLWNLIISFVLYMHYVADIFNLFLFNVCLVLLCFVGWFHNIILESTFEGHHTKKVQLNLCAGMILFILSEVLFFISLFASYFYLSFPFPEATVLDRIWPPVGIGLIDPWKWPLFNTVTLILSGFYLTLAHYELKARNYYKSIIHLGITLLLGNIFSYIQYLEYTESYFNISDGVYGSLFYFLTGFHGFHVIVGSIFLTVCFFRLILFHFTDTHHLGLEFAAWYWHFVDVVWLFLFFIIYVGGHVHNVYETAGFFG